MSDSVSDLTMTKELTASRIAEFKAAFDVFDTNNDGSINATELGAVMTSLGRYPTEEELKKMIQLVDADGNGSIELAEFIAMMTKEFEENIKEIKEIFRSFDKNGDKQITAEELKEALTKHGQNVSDDEINDMIKEADKNNDNKVNEEEFVAMMLSISSPKSK